MPPSEIREILLSEVDLLTLRDLRGSYPHRILSDGVCSFWFDYGTRYLAATTEEFVALSQNANDEALAIRPRWHDGPCKATGQVLFEKTLVEEVLVVRSLLWFTDHVRFETKEQALAGVPSPRNDTEKVLREILAKTTGGHEECVSNPTNSTQVAAPVANIVDVGFVAVVQGRFLACFSQINCYLREADFVDQLRHDFATSYDLISLEAALQRAV